MLKIGSVKTVQICSQLIILVSLLFATTSSSQNRIPVNKILDIVIANKNKGKLFTKLQKTITLLISTKACYQLTEYIYYIGKIELELENRTAATKAVDEFLATLYKATDSSKVLRQAQMDLVTSYESIGNRQKAYESNVKALKHTSQ